MGQHTYRQQGVTDDYLSTMLVPGNTGTVSDVVPIVFQTIDLEPDDSDLDDLTAAMEAKGWVYFAAGPAPAAKTIAQIVPQMLSSDAASIPVASGWVDVLSGNVTTLGNSTVGVQATAIGTVGVGAAQVRLRVNGGAFSNQVIGASHYDMPILSASTIAFNIPRPIADTSPTQTTYTFTLQMQATGILGTVVPKAGTAMTLVEYK